MTILEKYNSATWCVKICKEQRAIFKWWMSLKRKPCIGVDTETTGLYFGLPTYIKLDCVSNTFKSKALIVERPDVVVFGISLAIEKDDIVHLFWGRLGSPLYNDIVKLLAVRGKKAIHNARYDIRAFKASKIKLAPEAECTYTMSRMYWDRRKKHNLQALTEILCPELSDWEEPILAEFKRLKKQYKKGGFDDKYVNYSFIADDIIAPYSMTDVFMALMLYQFLSPPVLNHFGDLYEREKKVLHIVGGIEARGLMFDIPRAKKLIKLYNTKINGCCKKLNSLAGEHNPNSPKQVLALLLQFGVPKKELTLKKKLTTGADVLRRAVKKLPATGRAKKYIDLLLQYRPLTKTNGTYLKPLLDRAVHNDGVVYCSINPADSRTGRMASRDPNLQNIPEEVTRKTGRKNPVRSCFITRPDYCNYYFDYAQMEMVIFGLYAGEERILEAYQEDRDIHGEMASYVYGKDYSKRQRDLTKNLNFGIIYGLGIRTMALMYDMTEAEAKTCFKHYYKEFPAIREFQYACKSELAAYGHVTDWFGKRYHIPMGQAYKAVNALVQGSCASIFKIALIGISAMLIDGEAILLPIHDEIQLERRTDVKPCEKVFCKAVIDAMTDIEEVTDRGLQLRIDVSKSTTSWAKKEKMII